MDLYRRTRSGEVFNTLVELTRDQLLARVSARSRFLDPAVDPQELLQDAFINIYRYPDRFDASRPGAFRAWSTTIVDNSVRRYIRKQRSGPDVRLKPIEILAQEADEPGREPSEQAILGEQCQTACEVFALFLAMYLGAYERLSERERFVLQMVEVRGLRYAELAKIVGIRPEALKMVVFRARRRIAQRIEQQLMFATAQ
jgi:RNA polymerase sigma-70 factor (ECF subfamily)